MKRIKTEQGYGIYIGIDERTGAFLYNACPVEQRAPISGYYNPQYIAEIKGLPACAFAHKEERQVSSKLVKTSALLIGDILAGYEADLTPFKKITGIEPDKKRDAVILHFEKGMPMTGFPDDFHSILTYSLK